MVTYSSNRRAQIDRKSYIAFERHHWINMRSQIKNYIKCCETRGANKKMQKHPKAKLVPTIVNQKWQVIQIDVVGPFPLSKNEIYSCSRLYVPTLNLHELGLSA